VSSECPAGLVAIGLFVATIGFSIRLDADIFRDVAGAEGSQAHAAAAADVSSCTPRWRAVFPKSSLLSRQSWRSIALRLASARRQSLYCLKAGQQVRAWL
jgi:hypothetical protein